MALVAAILLAAPASSSAQCPFLAATLGKSSDEWDGRNDLWTLFVGEQTNHPIFANAPLAFSDRQTTHRDLRRYDHYKSGSAYKYQRNRYKHANVYSSLSDIWLCLACAVGWCVWLVSATRSHSRTESSVFESQQSKIIYGNVLQVTLGEDSDGTGIPVYHTLVDYVVESEEPDEEPLQVRKCFSTRKLLEEGFANVQVLVLLDDPTTSVLFDDFFQDKNERTQQQMEPPDMIYAIIVYLIACILIVTSLVGGVHAYIKLDPEQALWGKISLGVGIVLLYPVALLLYHMLSWGYRWTAPLVSRPGVIIHGAQRYWLKKCGATLNPLEVMGTFDGGDNVVAASRNNNSPPTTFHRTKHTTPHKYKRRTETTLSSVLEMSHVTSSEDDISGDSGIQVVKKPRYPNAGCGFGNFNVLMPVPIPQTKTKAKTAAAAGEGMANHQNLAAANDNDDDDDDDKAGYHLSTVSMSSVSSGGTGMTRTISNRPKTTTSPDDPQSLQLPCMDESDYNITPTLPPLGVRSPRSDGNNHNEGGGGYGGYLPPTMLVHKPSGGGENKDAGASTLTSLSQGGRTGSGGVNGTTGSDSSVGTTPLASNTDVQGNNTVTVTNSKLVESTSQTAGTREEERDEEG